MSDPSTIRLRCVSRVVHAEVVADLLARLTGDEPARERELRAAHRRLEEMGAPIRAAQAAREPGA